MTVRELKKKVTQNIKDMAFKLMGMSFGNDNKKETRRENKQVKRLAKLRKLEGKGKTDTKRYSKLKDKVYSPFDMKATCTCSNKYKCNKCK